MSPEIQQPQPEKSKAEQVKEQVHRELSDLKKELPAAKELEHGKDGKVTRFELNGFEIDATSHPLHSPINVHVIGRMTDQLKQSKPLSDELVDRTYTLTLLDDVRMLCKFRVDGQRQEYIVTPHDALRILQRNLDVRTEEEKKKYPDLVAKAHRLKVITGQTRPETVEEKRIHDTAGSAEAWSKVMHEASDLGHQADIIAAKEVAISLQLDSKTIAYEYDLKSGTIVREYDAGAGHSRSIKYTWNGSKTDTYLYAQKKHMSVEYNPLGGIVSTTRYDTQEKPLSTTHSNKAAIYQVLHTTNRPMLQYMDEKNRPQFVDPFNRSSLQSSQLPLLLATIDSKEKFDLFEDLYREDIQGFSGDLWTSGNLSLGAEIWKKGAELYGVRQKQISLEAYIRSCGCQAFTIEFFDHRRAHGGVALMKNILRGLETFEDFLKLYPRQFIRNAHFTSVIYANRIVNDDLRTSGKRDFLGGFYSEGLDLIAIDPLDSRGLSTLNHEVHHMIDARSGSLHSDDHDWVERFHGSWTLPDGRGLYGRGVFRLGEFGGTNPREQGFSSGYGMETAHEDQATVAEMFFEPQPAYEQARFAALEPVLAEKIAKIKHHYYVLSEGRMDKQYWKDIMNRVVIDAEYWKKREGKGDFENETCKTLTRYMEYEQKFHAGKKELDALEGAPQKNVEKLVQIYIEALTSNPYNDEVQIMLRVHAKELSPSRRKEFLPVYLAALQKKYELLAPDRREASLYEDIAHIHVEQGNIQEALQIYREGVKEIPRSLTLKRKLADILRKKAEITPDESKEAVDLLEKAFKQSNQVEEALALSQMYVRANEIQKALELSAKFMQTHALRDEAKEIRNLYETNMAKAGRGEEVIALYDSLANKNKQIGADYGFLKARFIEVMLRDPNRAIDVLEKLCVDYPTNKDVWRELTYYLAHYLKESKKEDRQEFVRASHARYQRLTEKTKNSKLSLDEYISFTFKLDDPKEEAVAHRFIYERTKDTMISLLKAAANGELAGENDFLLITEQNLSRWQHLEQELRPPIQIFEEIIGAAELHRNFKIGLVKDAFSILLLSYEKSDPKKAIELCEAAIPGLKADMNDSDFYVNIHRQLWYLKASEQPNRWIPIKEYGRVAVLKDQPGFLYLESEGKFYIRQQRWMSSDSLDWVGDRARRTVELTPQELPTALKGK